MKDPNSYYAESAREFDFVINAYGEQEVDTGIRVYDELEIDEKTSVITEKEISFSSPEETKRNYLKVIEVQELSEAEINKAFEFIDNGKRLKEIEKQITNILDVKYHLNIYVNFFIEKIIVTKGITRHKMNFEIYFKDGEVKSFSS